MRENDPFTKKEAALAAVRLHDSILSNLETERVPNSEDKAILDKTNARKKAIFNSESEWTKGSGGKVYYVSPNGNDNNSGLSPDEAWKTLDKVNSAAAYQFSAEHFDVRDDYPEFIWALDNPAKKASLNAGDVVLFERGGQWRGVLCTVPGVTYSAYGEGEKPQILGSPENGAGADKWSLVPGTNNVWVFYKELQDCGGILLGDDAIAQKATPFWSDETDKWYDVGEHQQFSPELLASAPEFSVKNLKNLYFFNELAFDCDVNNGADPAEIFSAFGKLYLRCDAGNPGSVYDSIEFFTGNNGSNHCLAAFMDGVTVDNLCFLYSSGGVQAQQHRNVTIRNCVISYGGGMVSDYNTGETCSVVRCGDGIGLGGENNKAVNNYIAQFFDYGITAEEYSDTWTSGVSNNPRKNMTISGNVIEYCGGGILVCDWPAFMNHTDAPTFTNITIADNYILYTGMNGWAHQDDYDVGKSSLSSLVINLNPGCSGIKIKDNVLYKSWDIGQLVNHNYHASEADAASFSGNIYLQDNYGILVNATKIDGNVHSNAIVLNNIAASEKLAEALGDTTAVIPEISPKTETVTDPDKPDTPDVPVDNPFLDVKSSEYYYKPVVWAVANGITNGTGNGKFSPNDTCTRGQIVTFLWRSQGMPEPTSTVNPFVDVKASNYFYKAVLWAAEKGITNGVDATHFNPEDKCTRAQAVTFLWRTAGKPAHTGSNSFSDVTTSYYTDAVLWAVEKEITNGTGNGKFSPNVPCTRGQIVTFLYRYCV